MLNLIQHLAGDVEILNQVQDNKAGVWGWYGIATEGVR